MYQRPTPIVLNLIIINVLVFIFISLNQDNFDILKYFYLVNSDLIIPRPQFVLPTGEILGFMPVQIVASMFSHASIMHIFFNMFALLSLGSSIERVMGPKRFLGLYLFSGVFSMTLVAFLDPTSGFTVGASGAISGVAVALAYLFPDARMGILFLPFAFKARNLVLGFAAISLVLVIIGIFSESQMGGISHFGHLTGMLGGWLFMNQNKFLNLFRK